MHISINDVVGWSQKFYSWKDYIDFALNLTDNATGVPLIYATTFLIDVTNANNTVWKTWYSAAGVPAAAPLKITYEASGYAISLQSISQVIADELSINWGFSGVGWFSDKTHSTVCGC